MGTFFSSAIVINDSKGSWRCVNASWAAQHVRSQAQPGLLKLPKPPADVDHVFLRSRASTLGISALLDALVLSFSRASLLSVLTLLLFSGCHKTKVITDPILGPDFAVTNVFRKEATLPASVRRVAVLPLVSDMSPDALAGGQMLQPVLQTELAKAGRFDLIFVTPGQLQQWTGQERWDYHDVLPNGFMKNIASHTDADAVIFARLSRFHAYPPIVVGWRMTLAALDADLLWSVDEVFDASEEAVSNSARRFDRGQVSSSAALEDSRSILLSPRKFGQYTARAVVQTLPHR
jgi:hypothetical protein